MWEDQQEPAWLASLREQQQAEQPQEQPRMAEDLQGQMDQADVVEDLRGQMGQADTTTDLRGQMGQADVMEDLREQAIQAEDELEYEERHRPAQFFLNLKPWQRLVLAVLLFLDVALCGCMALVMAGRVMLPF